MTGDAALLGVIEQIYDAIRAPDGFERAVAAAGDLLGSEKCVLAVGRPAAREIDVVVSRGYPVEAVQAYEQRYVAEDPFFDAFARYDVGGVFNDRLLRNREALAANATYQRFYRPLDAVHFLAAWLYDRDGRRPVLLFQRGERDGFYQKNENDLLRCLLPHFGRALDLQRRMAELDSTRSTAVTLLDKPPLGLVFLDGDGRMVETNQTARAVLDRADGLNIHENRLAAADPGDNRRLSLATGAARTNGRDAPREALAVQRPSGRRPYLLRIAPVESEAFPRKALADPPAARRVVLIQESDPRSEPELTVLRDLYGLTTTEARLGIMLAWTFDLHTAADALGITIGTARWHLKRIFAKTRTGGQAELIAAMGRAARF